MSNPIRSIVDASIQDYIREEFQRDISAGLRKLGDDEQFADTLRQGVAKAIEEQGAQLTAPPLQPQFANVIEFVDQFIAVMYPSVGSVRTPNWTPRWWEHPQAVLRLTALWHRFEYLRASEPATYMETFLRVHADYHMGKLMETDGVFATVKKNPQAPTPLKTDQIPTDLEKEMSNG
ncbi:DUF4913 domain-containing protein [Corynebacterium belfantii]|uniref:DUF4913 domain-containing protein n=1 Tax=Corynebacterium belfantii TaxID=2014537 RepID=A0ABS0L9Q8_9CORY|nr:DUF4913 domain-containing protein [Corynebacterium belfantii]OWM37104.1 hypothetical protein AZF07_07385 [Corynebacterium diphtheriae subsp. lausannense]MBG9287912.1 DUF4913 domain-containing protein [Corynebacterium belfantii]MBG9326523.1 DUF4913 domain-containing protein [Corynebacterium belfantii]MBG9332608.1 DUF4913 domain-containing protein [Corynebacterium belfantii]MBG9346229.1 DUF4913 domain-containing protein [Corynebacterium belfantii]